MNDRIWALSILIMMIVTAWISHPTLGFIVTIIFMITFAQVQSEIKEYEEEQRLNNKINSRKKYIRKVAKK